MSGFLNSRVSDAAQAAPSASKTETTANRIGPPSFAFVRQALVHRVAGAAMQDLKVFPPMPFIVHTGRSKRKIAQLRLCLGSQVQPELREYTKRRSRLFDLRLPIG
jgi:hypothetical protein